ncbi:MAG: alpha-E domain-containing protein, partial [Rhodothermales bacterium]|nr:alpha-E domain-containing protein [Rhodothermales bacterium]
MADSLYWMSRYLERAEHTARVIDINLHVSIDQSEQSLQRRWDHVARSLDGTAVAPRLERDPQAFSEAIALDSADPGSIAACILSARRNAREVREHASAEMWEQINRLYLFVSNPKANEQWNRDVHGFLTEIVEGARLFRGLTDATMSHNEGWHFIQLGLFIERVTNTLNLLDAHFDGRTIGRPHDGAMPVDDYLE